ncbi:hypothetical protein SAY86_019082 [Trapa natans]|uniref:Uncharacterized protein n=1 Tax=Trapa natans TaxID=22666 RepID=A0AAN7QYM6_TRANT|nr:hypothetical protein SAY86_019082 [Trapa natans]
MRIGIVRLSGVLASPLMVAVKSPTPASTGPGLEPIVPVGTLGRTWMLRMPSISSRTPFPSKSKYRGHRAIIGLGHEPPQAKGFLDLGPHGPFR